MLTLTSPSIKLPVSPAYFSGWSSQKKTDKTSTVSHYGETYEVELPTAVPGQEVNITFPDGCTENYTYSEYTAKFPKTLSKEIKMSFTLAKQTEQNRKAAADEAKYAQKGRKASVNFEVITWANPPYATLSIVNDNGDSSGTPNVYLSLNADDLKALQDATYKARVDLDKVEKRNTITNPSLTTDF